MSKKLVISAIGTDRPGIVDELSKIIYQHALHIEDSRMTVLGGEFAILILISGSQKALTALQLQVSNIEEALQMRLLLKPTTESTHLKNTMPYSVEVAALDNPGVVSNIASFFSSRNINIVNLQTERYAAPHTGTPMFAVHLTIGVPAETNITKLREEFAEACDRLNLDAELSSIQFPQDQVQHGNHR